MSKKPRDPPASEDGLLTKLAPSPAFLTSRDIGRRAAKAAAAKRKRRKKAAK